MPARPRSIGVSETPPSCRPAPCHPNPDASRIVPATHASASAGPSVNRPRPSRIPRTAATMVTISNPNIAQLARSPATVGTQIAATAPATALTRTSTLRIRTAARIGAGTGYMCQLYIGRGPCVPDPGGSRNPLYDPAVTPFGCWSTGLKHLCVPVHPLLRADRLGGSELGP